VEDEEERGGGRGGVGVDRDSVVQHRLTLCA
jgi:hypothetical protein